MLKPTATVELVMRDETGSTSALTLFAPVSKTVEEIDAAASAVASILASISGAVLVAQRIKYRNAEETRLIPAGSTPLHERAAFIFETGDFTAYGLITVPSIKDSIMLTDGFGAGYIVDTSLTIVSDFITQVLALPLCSPLGDVAISLVSAYRHSRV